MILAILLTSLFVQTGILVALCFIIHGVNKHDRNFSLRMWEVTKGFIEQTTAIHRFGTAIERLAGNMGIAPLKRNKQGMAYRELKTKPAKELVGGKGGGKI